MSYRDPEKLLAERGIQVGHVNLPSTGSYGSYQTATTRVTLPGGRHVLRVLISSGGNDTGNYDHFQLTAAGDEIHSAAYAALECG